MILLNLQLIKEQKPGMTDIILWILDRMLRFLLMLFNFWSLCYVYSTYFPTYNKKSMLLTNFVTNKPIKDLERDTEINLLENREQREERARMSTKYNVQVYVYMDVEEVKECAGIKVNGEK